MIEDRSLILFHYVTARVYNYIILVAGNVYLGMTVQIIRMIIIS
jgi:hypothetical protein